MSNLKSVYSFSDNGPILNINEDDVIVDIKNGLFGVIDGHGGTGIGDVGSTLIKNQLIDNFGKFVDDPEATLPFFYDPKLSLEINALVNSFLFANEALIKLNDKKDIAGQAGASLIVGVSVENSFHCVSVGHCLGLRVRNNDLSPFFLPDSNYQFSMMNYSDDNQVFPYSFLGDGSHFNYTAKSIDLEPGDKLFLMTDGVFQRVSGMDLLTLCQDFNGQVSELSDRLMALANDRGNKDNQSIIVLEY